MAVTASGAYDKSLGRNAQTSYQSYTYYSGAITTTDNFSDNVLEFGCALGEIYIVNAGSNPAAFQFMELDGTQKGSGMVPGNDKVVFRRANKTQIAVCSLTGGSATTVHVFGV